MRAVGDMISGSLFIYFFIAQYFFDHTEATENNNDEQCEKQANCWSLHDIVGASNASKHEHIPL